MVSEKILDFYKKTSVYTDLGLYEVLLNNKDYLEIVRKIENIKFITDGKWDWEHGLGHYKRVAEYVKRILSQLGANQRLIDLGMVSALLHDIGLIKGDKKDHALESSVLSIKFMKDMDITDQEKEMLCQAILDHSKGSSIQSLVGLALVLADKLDVTYHRTQNSSIQDQMNKEIQKIKQVDIEITRTDLIVAYKTINNFNVSVLNNWNKALTIPEKCAEYLGKRFIFIINDKEIDYRNFLKLDN